MAIQKTGNGSLVERAMQWAKDVGGKIKAAVTEYTGSSSYAKADAPAVKPNNASASTARAAAKFAEKPGEQTPRGRVMTNPYFTETQGEVVEIAPPSLKELTAKYGRRLEDVHGEYQFHADRPLMEALSDDRIDALLKEALRNPKFKAHFKDIQKELDRRAKNP